MNIESTILTDKSPESQPKKHRLAKAALFIASVAGVGGSVSKIDISPNSNPEPAIQSFIDGSPRINAEVGSGNGYDPIESEPAVSTTSTTTTEAELLLPPPTTAEGGVIPEIGEPATITAPENNAAPSTTGELLQVQYVDTFEPVPVEPATTVLEDGTTEVGVGMAPVAREVTPGTALDDLGYDVSVGLAPDPQALEQTMAVGSPEL